MEVKCSDLAEFRSIRFSFLWWIYWLRFSAWASENAEHRPALFYCVEAARREVEQFGSDFILIDCLLDYQ